MKTIKSRIAPNPREFQYWIDLTADKYGKVIKVWANGRWEKISSSPGSTEGTSDYNELSNKPSINGVTLMGNVALNRLDIQAASEMDKYVEDTEVSSLIPDEYVTETELTNSTYSKEEISEIVSDVEGTNIWNDVQ